LTNRKRLSLSSTTTPFTSPSGASQPEWTSLEEGWRLFERDLGKLQGFIEINATGFRKILKKWDKRSKSNTKEMYLERQVEVQPCFNREFIAKLSDIVAANLLDLESGSGGEGEVGLEGMEGVENASRLNAIEGGGLFADVLVDLESGLGKALGAGTKDALVDWLKVAKARQGKGNDRRLMRILWRAAIHVPDDQVDLVLSSLTLDYDYIDDINGRSPLHLAAIAGSLRLSMLCVETKANLLEKPDTYDRQPLHYAAMHGHPSLVSFLLERANPSATDMDGYTPLMHGITQGHLEVVRIFVGSGKAALEPTAISSDLIPLSLACQAGHLEVAQLLLERGASIIPNSEGLYPQHFAAKAGHSSVCKLLVQSGGPTGGGKDKADKYNLWTPLHHAAAGGQTRHLSCIKVLVEAGCDVNTADEYGKSPGWYAAWFGHVDCLNYLLEHGARLNGKMETLESMEGLGLAADIQMDGLSPGSDLDLDQNGALGEEFELIPSLSLPPPIIP
jgi:CDK inhibitor PHO81